MLKPTIFISKNSGKLEVKCSNCYMKLFETAPYLVYLNYKKKWYNYCPNCGERIRWEGAVVPDIPEMSKCSDGKSHEEFYSCDD